MMFLIRATTLRAVLAFTMLTAGAVQAQERFSLFVPSDQANVERMLKLADLRDDDVVVDLGSGDGRIVITAALMNRNLTGWGVDIDEKLVKQATLEAQKQGLSSRVRFVHGNAFDADLSGVTVISMWMWPEIQRMLRTKILAEARPGTRVVTNLWNMGDSWIADKIDSDGMTVHMWVVPAKIAGNWNWELPVAGSKRAYAAVLEQQFQKAEGVVRVGGRRGVFDSMELRGEDIAFRLGMTIDGLGYARHEFRGKVRGDTIIGTARVAVSKKGKDEDEEVFDLPWRATRAAMSAYFAPTGIGVK